MINVGILGLLIAAFFFGTAGVSQAVSNTGSNTSAEVVVGTNMPYGIGLSAELEAALKAANIRCATLATSERKAACVKENETAFRAKAEAMYKQIPAQDVKRIEFRGEPVGGSVKGGGMNGGVVDAKKSVDPETKGDVRTVPAPTGQGNEGVDFVARFEGVIARLVAYVDRFATLKTRIETRTADLSAKGVNVAEAKTSLANGQKHLESAKAAIEAARVSFKEEFSSKGMDLVADDVVKVDEKTVFSMAKFKICADTVKAIQMTAPERCVMNGVTYVNTDQKMVPGGTTDGTTKPTPAPGIRGAMGLGKFTKTKEHIKSAGQFLIQAQAEFMMANSFLTQAEANLK